jgi:Zn-dependent protease with chaperone function
MNAAGIALVALLAFAAPRLGAALADRRVSPRIAAALHLWALIGMAVAPLALLLCLADPGALVQGSCPGALGRRFPGLAWAALGAAAAIVARLLHATVRTVRATRAADPGPAGPGRAFPAEDGVRVHLLPVERPLAFAVGFRRGAVVVSRGLLAMLGEDLRRAALAHEAAHVREGHPALLLVARVVAGAFGGLPPVRRASASLRRELEAAADERAAAAVGDPGVVATAIAEVGRVRTAPGPPDVAYRVGRLLGAHPRSRVREVATLVLTGLLAVGVVASQCGALHAGALWTGLAACAVIVGWVGLRPLRPALLRQGGA